MQGRGYFTPPGSPSINEAEARAGAATMSRPSFLPLSTQLPRVQNSRKAEPATYGAFWPGSETVVDSAITANNPTSLATTVAEASLEHGNQNGKPKAKESEEGPERCKKCPFNHRPRPLLGFL
jgi:hypothetical protein